jgi:hypothetical protein
MQSDLMRELAGRHGFSEKFGIRYVDGAWPYLEIDHPAGAVRFIGEAKKKLRGDRVFLRGQVQQHCAMLPSLFRGKTANADAMKEAEKDLANRVRETIQVRRFDREDLPALLQHYGFRTSWLDAVDNLFVAAWFASNEVKTEREFIQISPSAAEYGWLFLISSRHGSEQLRHVDLRVKHHPLSARPHVQHGISLARKDPKEYDLRDFVVGTIRIPIRNYTTTGTLFQDSFLFPDLDADHTLRLLMRHQVNKFAVEIEKQ